VDLAPTILELTGAAPGRRLDGVSFAPALHGRTVAWRDTQLIQTGSDEAGGSGWDFRGVRTGRYTYMRRVSDGAEFLFDRRDDPFETTNLVWAPEYLTVLQALQGRHDLLIDCSGASCNRSFGPLPRVD
jgi:N-acetylglucosamine-6-sulfatase